MLLKKVALLLKDFNKINYEATLKGALASLVAMNAEPIYARSAPIACAARTAPPFAIEPDNKRGMSKSLWTIIEAT